MTRCFGPCPTVLEVVRWPPAAEEAGERCVLAAAHVIYRQHPPHQTRLIRLDLRIRVREAALGQDWELAGIAGTWKLKAAQHLSAFPGFIKGWSFSGIPRPGGLFWTFAASGSSIRQNVCW